ncbi:hypothetical protein, partial [Kitasatospora sp. NPDC093558]|uniref:hypothetical protein n=1 Tax=Kitasatospora sp. NPDC093558 TaxID=3155201 RepID=UPI00343E65C5
PADYRLVFVEKPRGHRLAPVRSSSDRVASVLFDAPTLAELDELDRRIPASFAVRTEEVRTEEVRTEEGVHA